MRLLPRALGLPVAAFALAMTLAAGPAGAAITITPASTAFSAALTGSAVFTTGGLAVTCTASSASDTTAASGPSVSFAPPSFGGCTTSSGNSASVVVTSTTAACRWTLTIGSADATGSSGAATAPGGKLGDGTFCMSIDVTLGGMTLCSITVSATTVAVTYVNATTSLKTDNPNAVPYTVSNGFCGNAGNATYAAQYSITPNTFQATST